MTSISPIVNHPQNTPELNVISERRHFQKFPNEYLVETGSCVGDGCIDMILCKKHRRMITLEVEPENFAITSVVTLNYNMESFEKFGTGPIIEVFNDSSKNLLKYIANIKYGITYWLDAHDSCLTPNFKFEEKSSLLFELDAIWERHNSGLGKQVIQNDVILIDDVRLINEKDFGFTMETVLEKLGKINPEFIITYLDGEVKNDILCCHTKKYSEKLNLV